MPRTSIAAVVVAAAAALALPVATTPAPPGSATEVLAATDMFLDLGPVKGESRD